MHETEGISLKFSLSPMVRQIKYNWHFVFIIFRFHYSFEKVFVLALINVVWRRGILDSCTHDQTNMYDTLAWGEAICKAKNSG